MRRMIGSPSQPATPERGRTAAEEEELTLTRNRIWFRCGFLLLIDTAFVYWAREDFGVFVVLLGFVFLSGIVDLFTGNVEYIFALTCTVFLYNCVLFGILVLSSSMKLPSETVAVGFIFSAIVLAIGIKRRWLS